MRSEWASALVSLLLSIVLGILGVVVGEWLLDVAAAIDPDEEPVRQVTYAAAGQLAITTGILVVMLTMIERALWPFLSVHAAWRQHRNDPAFMGRLLLGWFVMMGLFILGALWNAG